MGTKNMSSSSGTGTALMVALLVSGLFAGCFGETVEEVDEPPVLEGSIPGTVALGELYDLEVEIMDESLGSVIVNVEVNDLPVDTVFRTQDYYMGGERKFVVIGTSDLGVGTHKIHISAEDSSGQQTTWMALITITDEIQETDDDESEEIVEEDTQENNETTEEPVENETTEEPVENETTEEPAETLEEWWSRILLCSEGGGPMVDDYNTTEEDDWRCEVEFLIDSENITIHANGLPNHDFHSGPGCCASEQTASYTIPLEPTNDTGCNPIVSTGGCTMAPERGAVAFAVNGVAIYGPEDGPGGDAVAGQDEAYEEDRQEVWLGLCHGHSGPGGEYHYHADGNCMHWHAESNQTWSDYSMGSSRSLSEHSPIVGFAFDGYPIYGFVGWDENQSSTEMTSSYRLKENKTGYNGIDDYEYVAGMGNLDSCNGHYGVTPDYPHGTYHYHTTWVNGEGGIGFPYFINCYRGEYISADGDDPCAGHGETWGPGIGPPPDGCDSGPPPGQMGASRGLAGWFGDLSAPPEGAIFSISIALALFIIASSRVRGEASCEAARGLAGTAGECRPNPV